MTVTDNSSSIKSFETLFIFKGLSTTELNWEIFMLTWPQKEDKRKTLGLFPNKYILFLINKTICFSTMRWCSYAVRSFHRKRTAVNIGHCSIQKNETVGGIYYKKYNDFSPLKFLNKLLFSSPTFRAWVQTQRLLTTRENDNIIMMQWFITDHCNISE